jgi:PPOX class probable F420-dependent enzyme
MGKMTEQERQDFLADPRVGVLSVAGADGRPPMSSPVFYVYQPGGDLTFFTNTQRRNSRKLARMKETGTVTVLVQREDPPYAYVTIEGTVAAIDSPPTEEQMMAIATRYMPDEVARGFIAGELGDPETTLTVVTVRPDRWLTQDTGKD